MLIVDGQGLPLSVYVESAQPNERKLTEATLERLCVPQRRGRPRTRPKVLVADRNFDGEALRQHWRRRGIRPCIPRQRKPTRKHARRGRPLQLLPWYRQRWKVERTFAWLFNARRLLVRHERLLHCFDGFCLIACSLLCISLILK
jgi:transposase